MSGDNCGVGSTVLTVTSRRKVVSTREHLLMAWHRKMDRPGQAEKLFMAKNICYFPKIIKLLCYFIASVGNKYADYGCCISGGLDSSEILVSIQYHRNISIIN